MTRTYIKKNMLSSDEVEIEGADRPFSIDDTAKGKLTEDSVIATDPNITPKDISLEAFMAQELEIVLSEPANENEAQYAEVNVNNSDYRLLPRNGQPVKVRRYHVEVLCNAKPQRVVQKRHADPSGELGYSETMRHSFAYPFTVTYDPAGQKGVEWLKRRLAAPG